eukprot:80797_1
MSSSQAAKHTFKKRFIKTGLIVVCSAFCGGAFASEALRRKAQTNSLALNLMGLPKSHREILTTFENMQNSQLTPSTYVSSAESLLPHVRKLKPNISTHHLLRIQAASFLKKYHNALSEVLNNKFHNKNDIENEENILDVETYLLHERRKFNDMKLAFDFVNFKPSQVSENITNIVKFNKLDYARISRDSNRLRIAYDEIYSTSNKLEHELMALYTHAPYLGEWKTFMKIGDALYENYGKLEPINNNKNIYGHNDGINFNDLYWIGKQFDIINDIPTPMKSGLKFDRKPIKYIKIKKSNSYLSNWIELNNNNYNNDNIIPLGMCRLGAVQKTMSISKCVPRVQGPIFYDDKIKMRGSVTFMAPYKSTNKANKNNNIIPNNCPLNIIDDFIQIRQIEEWDLKPIEKGNTNEFKGKIIVKREPVDVNHKFDTFSIEYDCILKLGKAENYF